MRSEERGDLLVEIGNGGLAFQFSFSFGNGIAFFVALDFLVEMQVRMQLFSSCFFPISFEEG